MDRGLCVPAEHGGVRSDSDRRVLPKVEIKPLDASDFKEYYIFCGLYWEYWFQVNGEDLSEEIEFKLDDGKRVVTTELEVFLHQQFKDGFQVHLVIMDDAPCGFLLYQRVFDGIIVIRGMFLEKELIGTGAGFQLLDDLNPKKVIFQSSKSRVPEEMLKVTEPFREKVSETDKKITWIMNWEGRHGR